MKDERRRRSWKGIPQGQAPGLHTLLEDCQDCQDGRIRLLPAHSTTHSKGVPALMDHSGP